MRYDVNFVDSSNVLSDAEKLARLNQEERETLNFCIIKLYSLFDRDPLSYAFDFRFRKF